MFEKKRFLDTIICKIFHMFCQQIMGKLAISLFYWSKLILRESYCHNFLKVKSWKYLSVNKHYSKINNLVESLPLEAGILGNKNSIILKVLYSREFSKILNSWALKYFIHLKTSFWVLKLKILLYQGKEALGLEVQLWIRIHQKQVTRYFWFKD